VIKQLREALEEYPDTVPVVYCLMERDKNKKEIDRELFEIDQINNDGVHVLLIEWNDQ
jgi:hypothetical protein